MGDDSANILTVLMSSENLGLQEAVEDVCAWHKRTVERFLFLNDNLPSFGAEIDGELRKYIDIVAAWVRAEVEWSLECGRFFGSHGREIEKTRIIPVPPRGAAADHRAPIKI